MKISEYNPIENKLFQLIDYEGNPIGLEFPDLADDQVIKAFKEMLFARTADQMAVSFQRQGRMFTYPPNMGEEAIAVAAGMIIRENDWLVPSFRELGAWLAKGATLKEIFLYYIGNEEGNTFRGANHFLPFYLVEPYGIGGIFG